MGECMALAFGLLSLVLIALKRDIFSPICVLDTRNNLETIMMMGFVYGNVCCNYRTKHNKSVWYQISICSFMELEQIIRHTHTHAYGNHHVKLFPRSGRSAHLLATEVAYFLCLFHSLPVLSFVPFDKLYLSHTLLHRACIYVAILAKE